MAHRILLVEDDPDQRAGLAELLRQEGHDVREAGSAETALAVLEAHDVDLVIADYQLGGATGSWLARVAARRGAAGAPRALLMTAHDHLADADGLTVLRKPLDIPRLLAEIAAAVDTADAPPEPPPGPVQRIAFVLYVNGALPSRRMRGTLTALLARYDRTQIAFTLIDLTAGSGDQAEAHRVVATPTLVKTFPAPRVWITGELQQPGVVERLLEQAGVEVRR
ncbi:MAG TPA: response regulator [Vicinamibacterales bacterium]